MTILIHLFPMIIYLFVFSISLLMLNWASGNRQIRTSRWFLLYLLLALFPPIFLAAARSPEIGTDTSNYLYFFHEVVNQKVTYVSFVESHLNVEQGFLLFVYLFGQLFRNDLWFLFATHCLVLIPLFYAGYKLKNMVSLPFALFFFLFLFYNESLNLMRQYIAMSFIVLAVVYMILNKKIKCIIVTIIAISFHYTAVISILIFLIYYLCKKFPINKYVITYFVLLAFLIYSLVNIASYLDIIFPSGSDYSEKYAEYLTGQTGNISSLSTAIVYASIAGVLFVRRKRFDSHQFDFFFLLALLAFLFNFLSMYSKTLYRMSLYFSLFACLSMPIVFRRMKYRFDVITIFMELLAVAYWYFAVVVHGSNQTYPYVSTFLID